MAKKKKIDIKKEVMKEIKSGEVNMRPKVYFVLGSLLLIFGIIFSLALASFFLHHFIFRMGAFRPFAYFGMGRMGIIPFFMTFPWASLAISFGSVYGGIRLMKKYDLSYKKDFPYFVVGIILATILGTHLLFRANFSEKARKIRGVQNLYHRELRKGLPTPPAVKGVRSPGYRFR